MNTEQFDGHTPGPWDAECVSDEVRAYDILIWADDSVRYFVTLEEDADRRVIEPDARLIAAAPDLLAEVKRLRSQLMDAAYWLYDLREGCLPDACWPEIDALIETHTFGGEEE